jgi:hypothetical protein
MQKKKKTTMMQETIFKCSTTSGWIHKIICLETYVTCNITAALSWMMHSTREAQDNQHCKDFAVMTRCCSVKTNSCIHAEEEEEEENAGCLPSLRAASPASKNSSVMEDREEKSSIFLLLLLGHPHSSPLCPALLSLFSQLGCSMFLFTSLIPPLESILSHSELGASAATAAAGGVAAARGGATAAAAASALLSLEESEEFGGGSCTSDLPSRLLKLST